MTYRTPEEAAEFKCPVARTFHEKMTLGCDGSACILWRWKPVMASDPLFSSAVKREMAALAQEDGNNKPAISFHRQAVERVGADPAGFGVVADRGYCGLGGQPK